MLQIITPSQGATLLFITLLIVVIMFAGHKIYGNSLNKPNRKVKPHNDLKGYYKNAK